MAFFIITPTKLNLILSSKQFLPAWFDVTFKQSGKSLLKKTNRLVYINYSRKSRENKNVIKPQMCGMNAEMPPVSCIYKESWRRDAALFETLSAFKQHFAE